MYLMDVLEKKKGHLLAEGLITASTLRQIAPIHRRLTREIGPDALNIVDRSGRKNWCSLVWIFQFLNHIFGMFDFSPPF